MTLLLSLKHTKKLASFCLCIFRYYHYSAHSVADCMEDVTLMDLLAPTWENEKSEEEETNLDEKLEEDGGEVESTSREDDASEKDEL